MGLRGRDGRGGGVGRNADCAPLAPRPMDLRTQRRHQYKISCLPNGAMACLHLWGWAYGCWQMSILQARRCVDQTKPFSNHFEMSALAMRSHIECHCMTDGFFDSARQARLRYQNRHRNQALQHQSHQPPPTAQNTKLALQPRTHPDRGHAV